MTDYQRELKPGEQQIIRLGPKNGPWKNRSVISLADGDTVTITPAGTPPPPPPPPPPTPAGFVKVNGQRLERDGVPFRIHGASVLFVLDNADRDLDAAVAAGLNTVRIVDYLIGSTSPLTDSRWAKVDTVMAKAKQRGLNVILDLSTYRNWLKNAGKNPYTEDWQPFLNFVGSRYKAETTLALYSIAGEIDGSGDPAVRAQHVAFFKRVVPQLRAADPNHVIGSGGLLQYGWGGVDWKGIFAEVQLPEVHVYSQGDIDFLPQISAWCAQAGKPWLNEEFGQTQSVGDANRASYFRAMYARGVQLGTCGESFWDLDPDVRGDTFAVNVNTPQTWAAVVEHNP